MLTSLFVAYVFYASRREKRKKKKKIFRQRAAFCRTLILTPAAGYHRLSPPRSAETDSVRDDLTLYFATNESGSGSIPQQFTHDKLISSLLCVLEVRYSGPRVKIHGDTVNFALIADPSIPGLDRSHLSANLSGSKGRLPAKKNSDLIESYVFFAPSRLRASQLN